MSTLSPKRRSAAQKQVLPLDIGETMKQPEFHRRYQTQPDGVKYELVEGVVFMASPLRWPHGAYHVKLGFILELYAQASVGVEAGDNATTILGVDSEPQPDLAMRIDSNYGGQSFVDKDGYVKGPPELVAEISHSTRSLDMNQKRGDYKAAGVQEYIVLCIEEKEVYWFHFPSARRIKPNKDGIAKSKAFPGLWLNVEALLAADSTRTRKAVEAGLASAEHARFVKKLEGQRKK